MKTKRIKLILLTAKRYHKTSADSIRDAIRRRLPLYPLVDSFLTAPQKKANPLLSWALKFWTEDELREMIGGVLRSHLPKVIKNNQETLQLLNSSEGRDFLHRNLDSLLDYLTSTKFRGKEKHTCPGCKKNFEGKLFLCPNCSAGLKYKI